VLDGLFRRALRSAWLWDHRAVGNQSLPATARLTAAGRAVENRRADRLFEDPLAEALAGEEGFRLMERWRLPGAPRENPTIGPRTRFYDDLVIEAVAAGLGQVVLIAAGMDTRAFRLLLPSEVTVFEVDLPELLAQKQAILEQEHAEPRCRRVVVAADLAEDDWPQALTAAGFKHGERTVFIVEGLSWYLSEEENARLLDDLARLAAPGSRLGVDIISRDHLESPAAASFFKFTAALGILWQFGTNDPAGFLAAHGWQAEVTDLGAFARRFGRWSPPDVPEDVAAHVDASGRGCPHQRQTRSASILLH
jgi:methyltransferase (TIGR00027 family)